MPLVNAAVVLVVALCAVNLVTLALVPRAASIEAGTLRLIARP